ncbi:LLM class flavin-dependent oxidoreductase [Dactylosporangium aurantiacum]|uniref:LLM class flavin-dependent oxidoreductase n=1 Tax=Dactylosporangium aurantiacum TaxID=35754 RepID=A0A9Q9IA13_9ACTN|nr:LLM class flavin-dependent oxidoreductase [Dactylosporangium aurantiacum]MDG6108892.1 LLM class flavin-dependent oxidoreductase [Dactylosporangium aurantiacum]UWZ52187.1 LLM class flavin-dependent oxidoreductase [Dactylosporangium aurantiacum]
MTDYGHELRFGTFLPVEAATAGETVRLALLTEELGLELTSVQDHPYQARFLDAWTLLSVIAARTTRLTVFPNVANLPLRPPAVLARAAASLDVLTGGRVELGLGAGAFWDAIAGMGGETRTPGASIEALEEGVRVIRALWSDERSARVDGTHYRLRGAHPGPPAAHPIGIWIGGVKPRMLGLVGRVADGWLPSAPYVPPPQLDAANRRIDDAAAGAGRDPRDIRRLYNVVPGQAPLSGPPKLWASQLADLALEQGMSTFILMVGNGGDADLRRFALDVVPEVRDLVAAARAGTAAPGDTAKGTATPGGTTKGTATPGDGGGGPPASGAAAQVVAVSAGAAPRAVMLDESQRPTGPAPDPDAPLTPAQRASGQHLVEVHDHLRQELEQLRDLVEQVATGGVDVGDARSMINTMTMRQNNWTLGTYCESYCRVVTTHHTIEDVSLFPRLRAADPRLVPVVDRLEAEHHIIADVLERVDAALVAMVSRPDGIAAVREAVALLGDTLLSHLAYEERELVEPLGRLRIF